MHRSASPDGSRFAVGVIGRLRYTVTLDDRSADFGRNAVQVAPGVEPDPVDPSSGKGHDRYDPDAEGEDGFCAPAAHPDRSPSVEQILLALRLADDPFDPDALRAALRAPSALDAARWLAGFLQPPASGGPTLDAIAGDGPAVTAARRLVDDLGRWTRKELRWDEICRSLLLYGPPGTGKTWLARAMGASAGIGFIQASFAEWQACGHLGDMLGAMRKSFAEARRQAPTILFIDEIDAVGSRLERDAHSRYRTQVINGFLELMDSISGEEGVVVVGACNHVDRIDPAVMRDGRFDLKLEVALPDAAAIRGILERHLGKTFAQADLAALARDAVGRSAAEVDTAVRRARSVARGEGRELRLDDIRALLVTTHPLTAAWTRRVALHECGHALVGAALGVGVIERVLLTPQGGVTVRRSVDREGLLADFGAELTYAMAGRAAERRVLGEVSGGSGGPEDSDLAKATRLALSIDTALGLGVYGPLWFDLRPEVVLCDPDVRTRTRGRIEAAEARAEAILGDHLDHLEAMARTLARERLLAGDALAAWLAPVKARRDAGGRDAAGTTMTEVPVG